MHLLPQPVRILLACLCASLALNAAADNIEIPYRKYVLDNGLTLIVHEDDKAPVVAVNIWYHVGSKNEVPGRTGFAHLFEHLMFQGTENFNDEYLNYLQQLGATDLNATTWFDRTNYFETVPVNALDTVLWLESDRMGHFAGAITQDKLDEQRGVVQNEKRQSDNQPYGKVWKYILEHLFPDGHPYSWETIGSMAGLDAASLDDVRDWFATYYGPNNAVLSIAGAVEAEDIRERVEKFFGDIPPGPPLTRPQVWIPEHTTERRQSMQDRVPQARLYKAWTGPRWGTPEAVQLTLATRILTAGKTSRLYERLAYTDQTVTDINMQAFSLEISGMTYLAATAQPGIELSEIEAAINEEIDELIDDGPTYRELERAKTQLRAQFLRGIERVGGSAGKAGILAQGMVYGGSPGRYKEYLAAIENTTAKDIRLVSDQWLGRNAFIMEVLPFPDLQAATTGADRNAPPEPGPAPDTSFPAFFRTSLDNGLEIVIIERDNVPLVELSLLLDAGYAADQFASEGTTALAMAMLDEGTQKRDALEINDELRSLGASLRPGANLDEASISLSALTENLDESLEVFADVVLNPSFPENEFVRLQRNTLARIEQERTRPVQMALRVMPRLLYGPGHPYGQPLTGSGTTESVTALTREDLAAFHQQWFKPDNATLVVVGQVDREALLKQIDKLFGDWEPGTVPQKNLATSTVKHPSTLYVVDRPGADQSVIFAGLLVPPRANPNEIALQSANDILGGQFSARVNMNLREDKGWSYGARSLIIAARGDRPLFVYAPVQTDKTAESITEIAAEIAAMGGDNPPTEDELDVVKRSKLLSLPGRWETNTNVASALSEIMIYGLPDDYWAQYAAELKALTADDVAATAKSLIRPADLVWVVVGDLAVIEPKLGELGFDAVQLIDTDGLPVVSDK